MKVKLVDENIGQKYHQIKSNIESKDKEIDEMIAKYGGKEYEGTPQLQDDNGIHL